MAQPMRIICSSHIRNSRLQHAKKSLFLFQHPGVTLFCSKSDQPSENTRSDQFDERLLEVLVCPLSKKPLRYDRDNNELVSDSIGVAYPVRNGIPNLVPQDGRTFEKPLKADT